MNRILYLLIITFPFIVFGQHSEPELPPHKYYFSHEILDGLRTGEMNVVKASQNFSYIGEYQKALSVPNETELRWGLDSFSQNDLSYFVGFIAVPAMDEIMKIAEQEKVLIFNEEHHKPLHRVFIRRLLKGLFERGYNLLGLEALNNCVYLPDDLCDNSLMQRKFPLNSPFVGTYIKEPQMSNLIIDAINIGYEVFPYDRFGKDREKYQALYIAEKMADNPDSKLLVLGGGYHLLESENKISKNVGIKSKIKSKHMGGFLKEMTGIDPFTICQDILTERNSTEECPLMNHVDYREPMLFKNKGGEYYNGKKGFDQFDALIYHPGTRYVFNRPDWLVNFPGNKIIDYEVEGDNYPYLVKAYRSKMGIKSVPIDMIEKEYKEDNTKLVLPPGDYILEIMDKDRSVHVKNLTVH